MARIILCLFLLSTPMIMTPMDFSDSESGIIRHDGLLTVSCPPGYVVCLQTMACVPEEEPFGDDRDSEAESQDFVFICGADEVYCMERRQCISTNDMQDGEQPPAGCSKMGAAKGKYTGGMQQPVIACSADQVFCSSERVCVEMNDYNPFTQPQASTTTATSAVFTTESSISSVRDTTAPTWTEIYATASPQTQMPTTSRPAMAATARPTLIPAVVKERVGNEYNEFKETMNEVGGWFRLLVG